MMENIISEPLASDESNATRMDSLVGNVELRRTPRQERGRMRIDRLLDAADAEFAEHGFEGANTNRIAKRAGTSIGSLYQFFPNKEALLYAVAGRYLQQLQVVHNRVFTIENTNLPLPQMVRMIVRSLAEFYREHPGFRPLFFVSPTSHHLSTIALRLCEECYGRVEAMLGVTMPHISPERRRLLAQMNVETTKALLPFAEDLDGEKREFILDEIAAMLLARNAECQNESDAIAARLGLPARATPPVDVAAAAT